MRKLLRRLIQWALAGTETDNNTDAEALDREVRRLRGQT